MKWLAIVLQSRYQVIYNFLGLTFWWVPDSSCVVSGYNNSPEFPWGCLLIMLELTAIFESWHIGDGNYPPFQRGMLVNLSFQIEPTHLHSGDPSERLSFNHVGNAEYDFCGEILRIYHQVEKSPLAIIEADGFRFYIETSEAKQLSPGMRIAGRGTLLLDYFIWVENLSRYLDPPDIFFSLEVTGIRKVQIPERFIYRSEKGKAFPSRVPPEDFGIISEIEKMEGQRFDEEFYLVDFKATKHKNIPKTFLY